jgi:hypothetical protein
VISSDTSREAEAVQLEGWRRMSTIEIARTIRAAWSAGQRMAWIGLRERYPEAQDDELRVRFAVQMLGVELAIKIHPDASRFVDGPHG